MASRSSLYKWKGQEKPSIFASRGNVQEWVKQVQKASDDAARDIFGDQPQSIFCRRDVLVDDAAISEAQDLLDSWIQKKKVDDLLAECDLGKEKWAHADLKHSCHGNVKGLEQFSLGPDGSIHCDPLDNFYQDVDSDIRKQEFELNDEFDEEYALQEVVHDMLEKDIVDVGSVNAEIFQTKTTKFKDPTPKMELRHKQVKEKAKERKVAWEKAHLKKMTKKMVEQEARRQLLWEEKEHQNKAKREEEKIQREMVKIRKALEEENALRAKQRNREREKEENANKLAKREVINQQKQKEDHLKRELVAKKEMKRLLLKQIEENEARKEQENLKLLQKCFSSWYAIIVNKRVKIGKARALSDWRHKLRTWNAWRTYVWRLKSDREAQALTQEMKERHRKEALADRFYCQLILQRCLTAWVSWVWKERQERKLKEQHDERANKMATLLKAASSGQLWQKRSEEKTINRIVTPSPDSAEEVEEIFLQPFKQETNHGHMTESSRKPDARNKSDSKIRHTKRNVPRQAWPHETLRDIKVHKSAGWRHSVTEAVNTEMRNERDSPRSKAKNDSVPRVNQERKHESTHVLAKSQSVSTSNRHDKTDVSHAPERNKKILDNPDRLSSVTNVKELDIAPGKSKALQSSRSASSCVSKQSKVSSKRPVTKPLHLAMEERAKARAERKTFLEMKKREAEEENLARLKQEQERKENEILAEKQAMLQKKREEKKIAKQRDLEKQQRAEEIKQLNKKADDHYHRTVVRKYGVEPWKKLVGAMGEMMLHAQSFSENRLLGICLREWSRHTKTECELRNELASELNRKILLRRGWQSWRKYRYHLVETNHIAREFSKRYLARKYLRLWQDYVTEERLLYWDKENKADEHNERRLKQLAMTHWKRYIPLLREEEDREKRRNELRKRVQSLLPDFRGIKLSESP